LLIILDEENPMNSPDYIQEDIFTTSRGITFRKWFPALLE
jgi:hypothetical protein